MRRRASELPHAAPAAAAPALVFEDDAILQENQLLEMNKLRQRRNIADQE
jgi:hypothetical protein